MSSVASTATVIVGFLLTLGGSLGGLIHLARTDARARRGPVEVVICLDWENQPEPLLKCFVATRRVLVSGESPEVIDEIDRYMFDDYYASVAVVTDESMGRKLQARYGELLSEKMTLVSPDDIWPPNVS